MADARDAYVWVWLPGHSEPVVAGRLDDLGRVITFTYGRTYLARPDAVALYLPELPLRPGEIPPLSGDVAGCIADAGPDAWGRRVIEATRASAAVDLRTLDYLLESGSERAGALDFQASPDAYVPRSPSPAALADLLTAAEAVERGDHLAPELEQALLHGSSVGGARPKATLRDGDRQLIAKFPSSTDPYPVVKAEFVAMELAQRAGINVAAVAYESVLSKDVLLVERFDRTHGGGRRMVVSALTILELHDAEGVAGRYGSYVDLAAQVRARFTDPDKTLRELFSRLTFNILVGNTDDHPRNHAAFWDGSYLTLSPAYDICPQQRSGGEAAQAMAYGLNGERISQVARCVAHAGEFHLTEDAARQVIDHQMSVIRREWDDVCDRAGLSDVDRERLWGRQFMNPFALYDY